DVRQVEAADVDFQSGLWVIRKHKTVKKTGRPLRLPLNPAALDLFRRLAYERPEGKLFLNRRGKPWTAHALAVAFIVLRQRVLDLTKVDVGNVCADFFRHTFATGLLEAGQRDTDVAALLGHKGTTMLHHHYSHILDRPEHLRKVLGSVKVLESERQ